MYFHFKISKNKEAYSSPSSSFKSNSAIDQLLENIPIISSNIEIGTPISTICSTAKRDKNSLII
jgi:hypothetical protein